MDIVWNIVKLLASLGILGGIGWLLKIAIAHKATELSLEEKINSFKEEKTEFKQRISFLENENIKLKEQTSKKPLIKDQTLGCYVDQFGHKYCLPCYENSGNEKRISLQPCGNKNYGWECPICKNVVRNPNYKSPYQPPPSDWRQKFS